MPGYIVVNSTVKNNEKMKEYIESDNFLEEYGGRVITKGVLEVLSGSNPYNSMLIIEFSSKEKAKDWFYSKEYQTLKREVLDKATDNTFITCKTF